MKIGDKVRLMQTYRVRRGLTLDAGSAGIVQELPKKGARHQNAFVLFDDTLAPVPLCLLEVPQEVGNLSLLHALQSRDHARGLLTVARMDLGKACEELQKVRAELEALQEEHTDLALHFAKEQTKANVLDGEKSKALRAHEDEKAAHAKTKQVLEKDLKNARDQRDEALERLCKAIEERDEAQSELKELRAARILDRTA